MYIPVPRDGSRHVCTGCCFTLGTLSCTIREIWGPSTAPDAVSVCDQRLMEHGIPPSSVNQYHWAKVTDSATQLPE